MCARGFDSRVLPQSETSIKDYYIAFTVLVLALIAFGGYVAPMAEVKLGLGCATAPAPSVASLAEVIEHCLPCLQGHVLRRICGEHGLAEAAERGEESAHGSRALPQSAN